MSNVLNPLPQMGWSPQLHLAISQAAAASVQALEGSDLPPLAVFDCDNTCIRGDIGDVLWESLVAEYKLDLEHPTVQELVALVDPDPERALQLARDVRSQPDLRRDYLQRWLPLYPTASRELGYERGLTWVTQIMAGISNDVLKAHCAQAVEQALTATMKSETSTHEGPFEIPGVRICREVKSVIAYLQSLGFCCAIVSASCRWPVQAIAPKLGIRPEDVLAIDMEVDAQGVLTSTIIPPVTYRQGKLDAIVNRFGRSPQMVFGDAITDFEMLRDATQLGVLIDRDKEDIREAIAPFEHIKAQPRDDLHFDS